MYTKVQAIFFSLIFLSISTYSAEKTIEDFDKYIENQALGLNHKKERKIILSFYKWNLSADKPDYCMSINLKKESKFQSSGLTHTYIKMIIKDKYNLSYKGQEKKLPIWVELMAEIVEDIVNNPLFSNIQLMDIRLPIGYMIQGFNFFTDQETENTQFGYIECPTVPLFPSKAIVRMWMKEGIEKHINYNEYFWGLHVNKVEKFGFTAPIRSF